MTEIDPPSDKAVASPTRPKHWLRTTLLYSLIVLVLFWTIRPTARPFIPWLNPTAKPYLRADGDKHALVVGGFTNGAALYGVKVRVNRDGQPVQRYVLSKVEPGFLYPVTTPPDASGQISQVYVQSGDTITLEANTYLVPLVYRFEQLEAAPALVSPPKR